MTAYFRDEMAKLSKTSVKQLRRRYEELFGEATGAANKAWLVKRLAWRVQALAEGGLSERALARPSTRAGRSPSGAATRTGRTTRASSSPAGWTSARPSSGTSSTPS